MNAKVLNEIMIIIVIISFIHSFMNLFTQYKYYVMTVFCEAKTITWGKPTH